jgi:enoyl-CoA hydratase/carnithine racemase
MPENFLLEKQDNVALLTINRPSANAISVGVLKELAQLLDELEQDDTTRVIVITGAGARFFSAGADVKEFGAVDLGEQVALGERVFRSIEAFNKPIIAAVNGLALGGGCELALACHLRFAADTAQFGQPEVKLGIIPGWGGTQRLSRLIGKTRALEYLLTGDRISAADAERFGLVNRMVPAAQLVDETVAFARKLARGAPLAQRAILECVDVGLTRGFDTGSDLEREKFIWIGTTEDAGTGFAAFMMKTEPEFKGK